jgi:hypothetical protein
MGLMDRLKETAQDVATEAKKAGAQAQGKLEEVALRRKLDDAARELGYLFFRERAKAIPAGSDADSLVSRMRELEEQLDRHDAESGGAGAGASPDPSAGRDDAAEETQPGAAAAQSPPEGRPTDQSSSG